MIDSYRKARTCTAPRDLGGSQINPLPSAQKCNSGFNPLIRTDLAKSLGRNSKLLWLMAEENISPQHAAN
ncbi:unnamed protein product [Acanthoscelides obtectus]|uniref:Uncharacterized protein n=1 Tax=Acanthoscelides obtectus TaxID=200917 RepID=A0A9P0JPG9_ACAOB|nr:unnamed protein product [Acanthoscelides obtectus]CAK1642827.1 hypothetical protein AOBTE_LOCUS13229 [Acanthoscelides obtectus]